MNENFDYKRLLIVANEGISNNTSNGRTLRNFLVGWPLDKIAQFYIIDSEVDCEICSNYYQVSDRTALDAFLHKNRKRAKTSNETTTSVRTKVGRDAITMIARNIVWNSRQWWNEEFDEWLSKFSPEIVLLQAGDSAFTFRLAEDIAKKYQAKLVIYNSENWYFKAYDYFRATGIRHFVYPLFRLQFCRQLKKTTKKAAVTIYNSKSLQNDYDQEFHLPSEVLYTSTEMKPGKHIISNSPLRFAYLGNLGLDRHRALIEIAEVIHSISDQLFLDVYGGSPNQNAIEMIKKCEAIRYHGVVPYEEVVSIMHNCDVLVHAECSDEFYREGLKRAFSTKIADSLATGRCFVLYAPRNLACSEYLLEQNASYVITEKNQLYNTMLDIIHSSESRNRFIQNALLTVEKNHNPARNASKFKSILLES